MKKYTIDQLPKSLRSEALDNFSESEEYYNMALAEKNEILDEVRSFCEDAGIKTGGSSLGSYDNYFDMYVDDFLKTNATNGDEGVCYYGHLAYEWGRQRRLIMGWLDLARLGYEQHVESERECFGDYWFYEDPSMEDYMEEYVDRATEMADEFVSELKFIVDGWLDGEDDYYCSYDYVKDEGILFNEDGIPLSEIAA